MGLLCHTVSVQRGHEFIHTFKINSKCPHCNFITEVNGVVENVSLVIFASQALFIVPSDYLRDVSECFILS